MYYVYTYIVCTAVIFFVGLSLHAKPLISLLAGFVPNRRLAFC